MKARDQKGRFIKIEWTDKEISLLAELYPNTLTGDIAKKLGRTNSTVHKKAYSMGLRKSKEFLRATGKMSSSNPNVIASQFPKGYIPKNKGKKMSAELYERTKHTFFRKGNIPSNCRPVGSERVLKDGYVEIKTADPNKWELKHRVVWVAANGEIPKGYNIQFKDGNRQNFELSNLYAISRNDQLYENTIHRYPEEVKKSIYMLRNLNKIIGEYEKTDKS